jgi:hypothetical protein
VDADSGDTYASDTAAAFIERRNKTTTQTVALDTQGKRFKYCRCSLSLWRVVRGSKLMHLDSLIHGLFIT